MAQTATITQSPLWDRVYLPSTTNPTENKFFVVPAGSADPNNAGTPKTKADTNMLNAGRLSDPESFDVFGIALSADFDDATEADLSNINNTSWIEFYVGGGQTLAWEGPTRLLTAGCGFAFTKTNGLPQNGYPAPSAIYMFKKQIVIGINESFYVSLKSSGAFSLTGNRKLMCKLHGDHYMVDVKDAQGRSLRRSA